MKLCFKNVLVTCVFSTFASLGYAAQVTLLFENPTQGIGNTLSSNAPGTTLSFDIGSNVPQLLNPLIDVTNARLRYTVRSSIDIPARYDDPANPNRVTGPVITSRGFEPHGANTGSTYVVRSDINREFYADNQLSPTYAVQTNGSGGMVNDLSTWQIREKTVYDIDINEIDFIPETTGPAIPEIVEVDTYKNVFYELAGIEESLVYNFDFKAPSNGILDFEFSFLSGTGNIELLSAELLLTADDLFTSAVPLPAAALLFPGAVLGLMAIGGRRRRLTTS